MRFSLDPVGVELSLNSVDHELRLRLIVRLQNCNWLTGMRLLDRQEREAREEP